jgi:hypothetical protein
LLNRSEPPIPTPVNTEQFATRSFTASFQRLLS